MNNTKEKNNLGDIMQQVIVFGTGKHWENHRRLLRLDYEVIGFMDNNKSKQGMQYQGKNIYAPEQLFEVNFDKLIVASTAKDVILRQLIDLGISTEKIEILNCCRLVDSKKYSSTINFDGSVDYHIENIFFRCNTRSDHNVVQEIFDDGNYNYTNQKDQFIVIDVGMNIGIASLYFAQRENVTKVYAFEPFAETFKQAKENIKRNIQEIQSKIVCRQIGLDRECVDKYIKYNADFSGGMATFADNNSAVAGAEVVRLMDAGEMLAPIISEKNTNKIILKIDCEGSEYAIAESLEQKGIFDKIDVWLMEWHDSSKNKIFTDLFNKYHYQYVWQCGNGDRGTLFAIKS